MFTGQLSEDHRAIETMLATIEAMCKRLESGQSVKTEHLHAAVEWIREFVGGWHLNKEENLLFPALARASASDVKKLLDVFLHEHHLERHLFAEMARAESNLRHKRKDAAKAFCFHARKYISELSPHIQKEDEQLYPSIAHQVDKQEQTALWVAHQELEEQMGKQWLARMMKTLKLLSAAYP